MIADLALVAVLVPLFFVGGYVGGSLARTGRMPRHWPWARR